MPGGHTKAANEGGLKIVRRSLAIALLIAAALPATASATTHWYHERALIPEGQTAEVESSGSVQVVLKLPNQSAIQIPCAVHGEEAFWNTPQGGKDETRSIAFSCSGAPCGKASVTPSLPWGSTLLEGPLPLIDQWEGVALKLSCGGVRYGAFSGSLVAKVGDVDPEGSAEETKDDLDNVITFRGGLNRPHLVSPSGASVWFGGHYHLGTTNHTGISDESGS